MKRLLTAIFAIALIGVVFTSCKKDENSEPTNTVTIEGTFTVGDKTFTNPTFDLGEANSLIGYLTYYADEKTTEYNTTVVDNYEIDLGDNYAIDFGIEVYSAIPGNDLGMYAYLSVYQKSTTKQEDFIIHCLRYGTASLTKVGELGEYIEGTFEGDFSPAIIDPMKNNGDGTFHVKGKFKVKRVTEPIE